MIQKQEKEKPLPLKIEGQGSWCAEGTFLFGKGSNETEHPERSIYGERKKTNGIGNWQDLLYSKFNIKRKW